ncbi:hypothetical protein EGW08_006513, partial [Elysia chlorotica]
MASGSPTMDQRTQGVTQSAYYESIPYECVTNVGVYHMEKQAKSHRVLSYFAVCASLFALLLAGSLIGVLLFSGIENLLELSSSDTQVEGGKSTVFTCVACNKLLYNPTDLTADDPLLRKLTVEVKDGVEQCCAYGPEQITTLFESVMRLNEIPDPPLTSFKPSDFRFSPVSAHKRIYPTRILRTFGVPEIPQEPLVCLFKPDDPRYDLEHHRGVEVLERGLRVQHSGLYYVYTSILFRPQSVHPCREFSH